MRSPPHRLERTLVLVLAGFIAVDLLLVLPAFASEVRLDHLHPSLPIVNLRPLAAGRARITDGLGEEFADPVQRIAGELEEVGAKAFNAIYYAGDAASGDPLGPTETPTSTQLPSYTPSSTANSSQPNPSMTPSQVAVITATVAHTAMLTASPTPVWQPTSVPTVRPSSTPFIPPSSTPVPSMPSPTSESNSGWYYVAPDGDDTNPGTIDKPWRTIHKSANTVQPGDTVFVRGGTYRESIQPANSGTTGNIITYQAYPEEEVVIDGGNSRAYGFYLSRINYVRVDGFTIRNVNGEEGSSAGIALSQSSNNVLANNTIENNTMDGIFIVGNSSNNVISENSITGNERSGLFLYANSGKPSHNIISGNTISSNSFDYDAEMNAIMVENGDGNIIENNVIMNNAHGALLVGMDSSYNIVQDNYISGNSAKDYYMDRASVSFWQTTGPGNVMRRNIVIGTMGGGFVYEEDAIYFGSGIILDYATGGVLVENNLVYDNTGCGIDVFNSSNNMVFHNVFYSNKDSTHGPTALWVAEIRVAGSGSYNNLIKNNIAHADDDVYALRIETPSNNIEDYNDLYRYSGGRLIYFDGNSYSFVDYQIESGWGQNSISQDPLFVNPLNDFRLQANSPAIDAGTNTGVREDFDGNARPQGNGYDIGAYEY